MPQIIYEERIVEVPDVEVREVIKEVSRPVVKTVDKNVTKHVMQYREKIVDVPSVLNQEHLVEAVG